MLKNLLKNNLDNCIVIAYRSFPRNTFATIYAAFIDTRTCTFVKIERISTILKFHPLQY
jgi:hypothetical protein